MSSLTQTSVIAICTILAGACALSGAALAAKKSAAGGKEPPACAAITFRPVAPGLPDGDQDAGLYKSRFGRIELKAAIKSGEAQNYFILFNGKPPAAASGGVPKSAEPCLQSKHVKLPVKSAGGACIGTRFRVVIDHSSGDKLAMLFGLQGNAWQLCSTSKIG